MHALILDMIVEEEYRSEGVGSKIMKNILQKCKEEKIRDVQLFSVKDACEFYEKNGFKCRPEDAPGIEMQLRY
ncbi:MAG: GNAT family N-acetyltransferase [Thermoplasmatota archaeon]